MPCLAIVPRSSSQYVLLSAAFCRSMTRPSQLGSCTPTKPHSLAHFAMSLRFCICGPPPANCARNTAGPLMVFTSAPKKRLSLTLYGELGEVVGADLCRIHDRPGVRLFLLVEVVLHAIRMRGADDLLPVDGAFAHGNRGRLVRVRIELADVLHVQRDHAALVLVEDCDRILRRGHGPTHIELDLHEVRIGGGKQGVEAGLAVELFELDMMVVITE